MIAATQQTPTEIQAQSRAPRTIALRMPKASATYGGPPCSSRTRSADAARAVTATTGPGQRRAPIRARGPTRASTMLRAASAGSSCEDRAIQIAAGTCTRNERMTGTQRVTAGGSLQAGGPPHGGPPHPAPYGSPACRAAQAACHSSWERGPGRGMRSMLRGRLRGGVLPWEYGGQSRAMTLGGRTELARPAAHDRRVAVGAGRAASRPPHPLAIGVRATRRSCRIAAGERRRHRRAGRADRPPRSGSRPTGRTARRRRSGRSPPPSPRRARAESPPNCRWRAGRMRR